MRTQAEILERIEEIRKTDFWGFEASDLIDHLDYKNAKPFLKEGVKDSEWDADKQEDVKKVMINYMEFAWKKANDFRGISTSGSLSHFRAWLWIDGSDEALKIMPGGDYTFYGKNELCKICNYLGLDSKKWDDGVRLNEEPD